MTMLKAKTGCHKGEAKLSHPLIIMALFSDSINIQVNGMVTVINKYIVVIFNSFTAIGVDFLETKN